MQTSKVRLVMKRLRDVKPGDLYVGRQNWTNFTKVRRVIGVHESAKKPGKLSLVYDIESGSPYGKVRRWPDFYVIIVKDELREQRNATSLTC